MDLMRVVAGLVPATFALTLVPALWGGTADFPGYA
jgi:hypothetical protein